MTESKKIAAFAAEALNVVSKLINKKGFFAVFQLSDEAAELSTVKGESLAAEWAGDVKAHAAEVVSLIKAKLDLEDKLIQAKIEKWLDLSVDVADLLAKSGELVAKIKGAISPEVKVVA